jgi:hypothetical protein
MKANYGKHQQKNVWLFVYAMSARCTPNDLYYPLVGKGWVHPLLGGLDGLDPPSIAQPRLPSFLYNRMQLELSGMRAS